VVSETPVAVLVTVTVAFGTAAPLGSRTVPTIDPVSICAQTTTVEKATMAMAAHNFGIEKLRDMRTSRSDALAKTAVGKKYSMIDCRSNGQDR
jgi:hypothetical protein